MIVWVALAVGGAVLALGLSGRLTSEGPFPDDSESGRTARAVSRHVPDYRGIPMALIFSTEKPRSQTAWSQAEATAQHERDSRRVADVAKRFPGAAAFDAAPPEVIRRAGKIDEMVTLVGFRFRLTYEEAQDRVGAMEEALDRVSTPRLSIDLLGAPAISERYAELTERDLLASEKLALPLTCVLLLVAFMSLTAALLPMLLASAVLAVTLGCLTLLTQVLALSVFTTTAVTILALGLGIDYSLFMVTRLREELAADPSMEQALMVSVTTTGRAIALSAMAIALSLAGLLAVGLPDYSSLAVGGICVSLVSAAGALTLLPAVVLLLGHRLDKLSLRRVTQGRSRNIWKAWAKWVGVHPSAVAISATALLLLLAIPATSLSSAVRPLGSLPGNDVVSQKIEHLAEAYGRGYVAPVEIATADPGGVSNILSRTSAFDTVVRFAGNGDWSLLIAVLRETPDTLRAQATIRRIREDLSAERSPSRVGGLPSAAIDLSDRIQGRTALVVLLACALVTLVLIAGLRSILIPLKAIFGTLLSVGATLGILAMLFPAEGPGSNIEPVLPLVLFTIVFGLSVDYEVFLLSRIREQVLAGADTKSAVSFALVRSARPITLAGLCLASVFVGLATSSLQPLQQLGIGVAIGVVIDVTVVRCMLMPAAAVLLGRWNWWLPFSTGLRNLAGS